MPDITICINNNYPKSKDCYRYQAKPKPYAQSYQKFELKDNECEFFWPVTKLVELYEGECFP